MFIGTKDFTELSSTDVGASASVTSMPAFNLKILQPSAKPWRNTTLTNTPYIYANMDTGGPVALGYNAVAVVGYKTDAPSRNWFRNALDLGDGWTLTNCTSAAAETNPPQEIPCAPLELTASSTASTRAEQIFNEKPGAGSDLGEVGLALRLEALVKQNGSDDVDFRLVAYSTAGFGTDGADGIFNLGSGTVTSSNANGNFSGNSASISALSNGWYRCSLDFTCDDDASLSATLQLLDQTGSVTVTSGESLFLAAPVLTLQTSDDTDAEYPVTNHDGTCPMYQVRIGWDLSTTETTEFRSGWKHMASRNVLEGFDKLTFSHSFATPRSEFDVWVEIWDPSNTYDYTQAERLLILQKADLSEKMVSLTLGIDESGGEQEADGGQIFRPQNFIRRTAEVVFRHATRQQAMDEIYRIQRTRGRSRQVFVSGLLSDERYQHEASFYGFLDTVDPIPSPTKDHWHWTMRLRETP